MNLILNIAANKTGGSVWYTPHFLFIPPNIPLLFMFDLLQIYLGVLLFFRVFYLG